MGKNFIVKIESTTNENENTSIDVFIREEGASNFKFSLSVYAVITVTSFDVTDTGAFISGYYRTREEAKLAYPDAV
jgi:hypothetical protein